MDEEYTKYGEYFSYLEKNNEDDIEYDEDDEDDVKPIYTCASDIYNDILKYRPETDILECIDYDDLHILTIQWNQLTYKIQNYGGYPDIRHILIIDGEESGWGWTIDIEVFCERHLCE